MKQIKQIFLEGESPTLNFDQFLSKMLVLFAGRLQKISGAIKNWSNWSKIVAVRFPTITSLEMKLEKIPIRALEFLLIWEVSKIYGKNIFDDKESKDSLVGLCFSYCNKLMLRLPRRKTVFFPIANFS